jgi:nitrogen fixation NifU-like protein
MMDDSLRELYQEVILDHSRHPRHFGALPDATHTGEGYNPLCGDRVKVHLAVDDSDHISDIKFEGKGCAISQASASLMTDMVVGRTIAEAEKLMAGFLHLAKGEDASDLQGDDRDRLNVLAGISEFPMRVKCATLAWHTMKSALEGGAPCEGGTSAKTE